MDSILLAGALLILTGPQDIPGPPVPDAPPEARPWPRYPWWRWRPNPPGHPWWRYPPIVGPYSAHGFRYSFPEGRTYVLPPGSVYVENPVPGFLTPPGAGLLDEPDPRELRDAPRLTARADRLFAAGYYTEAARRYGQAVLAMPGNGVLLVKLAGALFALGRYPQAASTLRQAVALLPDWPRTGADCRAGYGNPADFDAHLRAAAAWLKPHLDDVDALVVVGYMLHHSGRRDRAEAFFRRVLELRPDDGLARAYLAAAPATAPR